MSKRSGGTLTMPPVARPAPCPVCDEKPVVTHMRDDGYWAIHCASNVWGSDHSIEIHGSTRRVAIDRWNAISRPRERRRR